MIYGINSYILRWSLPKKKIYLKRTFNASCELALALLLIGINNENDNTAIGVVEYTVQETWSCGKQQTTTSYGLKTCR
jgi:hypothetical protein